MEHVAEDRVGQLIESASGAFPPAGGLKERIRSAIAADAAAASTSRRLMALLSGRVFRIAAVAAAAAVVITVFALWPSNPPVPAVKAWWQGPPSAWAGEISAALEAFESVTCRDVWVVVDGGRELPTSSVGAFSTSRDSYRRDQYDGGVLTLTQWYTPSGDGNMYQTDVHYDKGTYRIMSHKGSYGAESPVSRLTLQIRLLDRADALLGTRVMEGRECVGFEISAAKYGDNPPEWKDRIWFDVQTRLPVCVEYERPMGPADARKFVERRDQFNWAPGLGTDFFRPVIPQGFREEKG